MAFTPPPLESLEDDAPSQGFRPPALEDIDKPGPSRAFTPPPLPNAFPSREPLRLGTNLRGPSTTEGPPPLMMKDTPLRSQLAGAVEFAGEEGSRTWQAANTPMLPIIPKISEENRATIRATKSKPLQVASGVQGATADLVNSFTSPLGVMTLGMSGLPKAAQRIISGAFAAHMASQTPEIASALGEEFAKPEGERDTQKISELIASGAANSAFSALAGAHAATPTQPRQIAVERLLEQLQSEPAIRVDQTGTAVPPLPIRQLGVPRATAEPFLQPGVPELASAAMREQMSPIVQGDASLNALRGAVEGNVQPAMGRVRKTAEGGMLPPGEAPRIPATERTPGFLQTAENRILNRPEPAPRIDDARTAKESTPLRSVEEIVKDRLNQRDMKGAVEQLLSQPFDAQRAIVDNLVGVGRKKVPLSAAELTIFNQEWAKALDNAMRKPAEKPVEAPQPTPAEKPVRSPAEHLTSEYAANPNRGNAISTESGMMAKSVADLEALAKIRVESSELGKKLVSEGKLNEAMVAQQKAQFAREAIEVATDTGSWKESEARDFQKLGDRPLDWTKNPEAAQWLRENADALKINLPDEMKAGAVKVVEPPAVETPQSITQKTAAAAEALRKLKSGIDPSKGDLGTFNVIPKVWDAAIEIAAKVIEKGGEVAEAIEAAIKHIRANQKGEWFEREARRELELALSAPAKSKPSSPAAPPETAKPAPKTGGAETLEDVYRIFEPAPKEKISAKRQAVNVIEAVRTGVSSRFRPLNKLAQDVAQAYGLKKPKDIAGIAEQIKGSQGKGEADIYRFDRDVSSKVSGAEKDFNAYVFLRRSLDRLNQDLADIQREQAEPGSVKTLNRRSVSNYTIPQLESKLALLESKIGPEKLKAFEEAADMYQKHMDQALRLQVESGRMSVDQYNAIKSGNEFYAPFKVMKYMEMQSKPEGAGSRIDTAAEFTKAMKGIEDPNFKLGDMLAAARQSILMSRILADKNTVMRNISELSAFDTNGLFIKKLKSTQDAPTGMKAVKVLENGKENRYAVDESVYDALDLFGGKASGLISKWLSRGSVPFRAGATALNLPFQVSNLMADIPRTGLMSKYGVKDVGGIINPFDAARFILDYSSILDSIAANVFGFKSKLYLDFLDSGAAASTVQSALTPGALTFKEPTSISKSRRMAESVLYSLPRFSNAIEQTSKIVGIKRAMRMEGVKSGKELAKQIPEAVTEVRRFSGSPDFGRQGKWIEAARLNLLYMFLNARVQGAIADIGRLTGRDGAKTAAKAWVKIGTVVGIPTVYLWALNNRPENRDDYSKRSQQERDNYWLIPKGSATGEPQYIETEDGERVRDYWRIPKRESAKWVANMTEQMLNFSEKKDPQAARDFANSMFQELVPVNIQGDTATEKLESVASGLNPLIKAPFELATGRDLYRHRDIMNERMRKASPELQYTDRTATAFKVLAEKMPDWFPEMTRSPIILENLTKNLTAGLLTQFAQRKPVKGRSGIENNPLLQRFQSLPFVDNTEFKTEMQEMERESADAYLTRYREATKLLNDNDGKPLADFAGQASDLKTFRMLVDLYVSRANGATSQDRQVLSLPAEQRAKYVMHQLDGLNPEQKMQAMLDLARKRILTEAVFQEMARQLQDETQTQTRP